MQIKKGRYHRHGKLRHMIGDIIHVMTSLRFVLEQL